MGEERYGHADEKYDVELERLAIQASMIDPVTIRHLESIGVAEGWKCLEVGAGAGSIVQWFTQRVGPTGRIVATDIDLRFLNRLSAPNLEIRRHDILRDDLEKDVYDLVHCRLLLMHLPEPEKALRRMMDALRPGGWILIEEQDYGSAFSLDVTDPSANATIYATAVRAMMDSIRKRSIANPYFGREVRGLVEHLGFLDVAQEGWTRITRGGDSLARERATSWQAAFRLGAITSETVEKVHRLLLDPAFYYLEYTLFSAWGRKPVGEKRD